MGTEFDSVCKDDVSDEPLILGSCRSLISPHGPVLAAEKRTVVTPEWERPNESGEPDCRPGATNHCSWDCYI